MSGIATAIAGTAVLGYLSSSNAESSADQSTAAAAQSAAANTQLGEDQLSFAKQQYSDAAPEREWAFNTAQTAATQQLATQQQEADQSADTYNYNSSTFRPLEQQIVSDSQNYDTPAKRAAAAAAADANVQQSFGSAQDATTRALGRTGTVASGRGLALMQDQQYARATAEAGATTAATTNVENTAYSRQLAAADLGRNLASTATQEAATGVSAGSAATTSSTAGLNDVNSGLAAVGNAYSTAISANNSAGSLFNQSAGIYSSIANQDTAAMGGLGSALGSYLGNTTYKSDKNAKTGTGKRMDGNRALAQIRDTPVHEGWRYKPGEADADDGGRPHDGPMAQAVRRSMGDSVAPGGKVIDIASMHGKLLAGMQAIADRQDKTDKKLATMSRKKEAA